MNTPKDSPLERVQESFRQLSQVAPILNSASDKLGLSVARLENSLKLLGIGVSTWTPFSSWHSGDGFYFNSEEIGYTRVGGKWGLSIRSTSGNEAMHPDECSVDEWEFNQAPREMRVRAVKKIPELLEELVKDANSMATSVSTTADEIDLLVKAMESTVEGPTAVTKKKSA